MVEGGHRACAGRGKTEFPADWSDEKIINKVWEIANDLTLKRIPDKRQQGRYTIDGEREGIFMRVIIEPEGEGIITGYPIRK